MIATLQFAQVKDRLGCIHNVCVYK